MESRLCCCFFFNDTATTEIYTLSLHDALPISAAQPWWAPVQQVLGQADVVSQPLAIGEGDAVPVDFPFQLLGLRTGFFLRSEEHTSELQSRQYLVCRLLLEKKKQLIKYSIILS